MHLHLPKGYLVDCLGAFDLLWAKNGMQYAVYWHRRSSEESSNESLSEFSLNTIVRYDELEIDWIDEVGYLSEKETSTLTSVSFI